MLSYAKLSGNARRFRILMGMSLQEFDLLLAKVKDAYPKAEGERLSKRPRKRAIGAGRRFALDPRGRVMLLPFHYRTYATQDVAAEVFGVGQATVSRSIDQIAPVVRQCIPLPARIHDRAKRASTIEELEEILPGLRCLIDASEQQVQRPKRKDMEKSHYSGKAGRHTAKVQYTVNANGLIVHSTRHSPGRVHDVKVYRMKHPTLPSGLPSRDGPDGRMNPDLVHKIGLSKIPSKSTMWRVCGMIPESYLREVHMRIIGGVVAGSLAGDSTGYSGSSLVRWFSICHDQAMAKRGWIKLHSIIDISTRIILDYQVTDGYASDVTWMQSMLDRLEDGSGLFCPDSAYTWPG